MYLFCNSINNTNGIVIEDLVSLAFSIRWFVIQSYNYTTSVWISGNVDQEREMSLGPIRFNPCGSTNNISVVVGGLYQGISTAPSY